jgi:hypothetical protein
LRKNIQILVDQQSWQTVRPQFRKVFPFNQLNQPDIVNFGRAMLWVGMMSVSPRMPQWWAASLWAVYRYFAAVDENVPELRLHESIEDIDTNPKKVLSDDWGTGVGVEWLDSQFQYQYVGHGRNTMLELERQGMTSYVGQKKRGPQKCPDFFCVDPAGRYHLIECKGNQSGPTATADQFKQGKLQKANIYFTNEQLVSQRIVTGLAIANPKSKWKTQLAVIDPPLDDSDEVEPHLIVEVEEPGKVLTALKQVVTLDGLLLAGYFERAREILPETERVKRIPDVLDHPHRTFESNGREWQGQVYTANFPVPITTFEGSEIAGISMKFGVSPSFLKASVGGSPVWNEVDLRIRRGDELAGFRRRSFIEYGDSFIAEIELF